MQVIEEEKNAKTKIHVGVNEDSDDDLTLDQTVIVLSSGSSLDSPVTALQKSQSPQKVIVWCLFIQLKIKTLRSPLRWNRSPQRA